MSRYLDSLVDSYSPGMTWRELVDSMELHGYVPTVHPISPEARSLRREIEAAGFRVYPPPLQNKVRVRFTPHQMALLVDEVLPHILEGADIRRDPHAVIRKTYIELDRDTWDEVFALVADLDYERVHGWGRAETPEQYEFAVASFERSIQSVLDRIEKAAL